MTKFELVAQIERYLGCGTERLWRANKATLITLVNALAAKRQAQPTRKSVTPDERPIYNLSGGHLSRSVGPDWASPENYVGRLASAQEKEETK